MWVKKVPNISQGTEATRSRRGCGIFSDELVTAERQGEAKEF